MSDSVARSRERADGAPASGDGTSPTNRVMLPATHRAPSECWTSLLLQACARPHMAPSACAKRGGACTIIAARKPGTSRRTSCAWKAQWPQRCQRRAQAVIEPAAGARQALRQVFRAPALLFGARPPRPSRRRAARPRGLTRRWGAGTRRSGSCRGAPVEMHGFNANGRGEERSTPITQDRKTI